MSDGGCDTHIHFYDASYVVSAGAKLFPKDATPHDYQAVQEELGLTRVIVVHPTTYGLDNSCQLAGMAAFGNDSRGVMVVNADTPIEEITRLHDLGVRGARFHMLPGGAVPWDHLAPVAASIAPLGWHIQLQCNGHELAARYDELAALPTAVVVDHVGRFMPPVGIDDPSFLALLRLVETGKAWVKLSAPYESSTQPIRNHPASAENHGDVLPLIDQLVKLVPDRLLWATNWPHPGQDPVPRPGTLAGQAHRWMRSEQVRDQVLVANPAELYFSI